MSKHTDKPSSQTPEQSAPTTDQSGKPVDVVRKDIAQENPETEGVDKVITPTSIKQKSRMPKRFAQRIVSSNAS